MDKTDLKQGKNGLKKNEEKYSKNVTNFRQTEVPKHVKQWRQGKKVIEIV